MFRRFSLLASFATFTALVALMMAGCTQPAKGPREYAIAGKVTHIAADKSEVKINHQDIPGLMPAMEMSFRLASPELVHDVQVGDEVKGTLRVDGGYTVVSLSKSAAPDDARAKVQSALARLEPQDRALAESQKLCPISEEPLGSMGVPPKLSIKGQPVFTCCKGCNAEAEMNADATLAKVAALRKP